jgi:hypothetical protein
MVLLVLAGIWNFYVMPDTASAIPAFARKYKIACTVCHTAFPQLNGFGEAFAGNGYQFPGEDLKEQTVDTGDDRLFLAKDIPLAIRGDGFIRLRNDSNTKIDDEFPFALKLLTYGNIKKDISFYFYFLFSERGDVTGIEDAFLYFNELIPGHDLDLRLGQYQITDSLFPREQRLTFQDYTYYTTKVSDSGFDLVYDRAAELSYSFDLTEDSAMTLLAGIANGNGIGLADSDRNFDSDNFKNYYGRALIEFGGQSIGVYAYSGKENNLTDVENTFYRIGPDFNFTLFDSVNIWGSYLFGKDDNATFTTPATEVKSWGGFTGITYKFSDYWVGSLLHNMVEVRGKPTLDAHTVTANISNYITLNFKVMLEGTADLHSTEPSHPQKTHTGVLGLVFAY